MTLSEQPPSLSSRLTALAQRLGFIGRAPRQILERASHLHLPFVALPPLRESICWQDGPPLQRLAELPRGALSGPVQEDKAQAHAMLVRVIERAADGAGRVIDQGGAQLLDAGGAGRFGPFQGFFGLRQRCLDERRFGRFLRQRRVFGSGGLRQLRRPGLPVRQLLLLA